MFENLAYVPLVVIMMYLRLCKLEEDPMFGYDTLFLDFLHI